MRKKCTPTYKQTTKARIKKENKPTKFLPTRFKNAGSYVCHQQRLPTMKNNGGGTWFAMQDS